MTIHDESDIEIISASWRDLSGLIRLEKACFPVDAWPLIDLMGVLTFPNVVRLKALFSNKIVGFVAGDIRKSKGLAWIATLGVHPNFQRQGIGSKLLKACEDRLGTSRIRLSVRIGNIPAVRLYEHFGYQRIDTWRNYYQDGSDAAIFEKSI